MALKIAINGFGRIGRSVARIVAKRNDVELVAVNDLADPETLLYLTNFDSVHGPLDEEAFLEGDTMVMAGQRIRMFRTPDPEALRFADTGAEVVLECSGRFLEADKVRCHLRHGARRVVISAPAVDDTSTYVLGVNAHLYKGEAIVSNASCTTNCLGPIAKTLHEIYGIESGLMTTIHAYTGGQNLMDAPTQKDPRRCRAAAVNMVPTTTHAAEAIYKVLPELQGRLHGRSVRVPTPDVSLMDLDLVLERETTAEEVNLLFTEKAKGELAGILGVDTRYGVSQDFCGDPRSCIVAADLTQVVGGRHLKVMAWYDNEWGYANRLVEMALKISL
ncbi:type I glyceraldehyde-3-phosphate dehydrogenase [Hydrogenimonas sp.]